MDYYSSSNPRSSRESRRVNSFNPDPFGWGVDPKLSYDQRPRGGYPKVPIEYDHPRAPIYADDFTTEEEPQPETYRNQTYVGNTTGHNTFRSGVETVHNQIWSDIQATTPMKVVDPSENLREIIANMNAPPKTAEEIRAMRQVNKTNHNSIVEISHNDSGIPKINHPQTLRTYRDLVHGIEEAEHLRTESSHVPKLSLNEDN